MRRTAICLFFCFGPWAFLSAQMATSESWNVTGGGLWGTNTNWTNSNYPTGSDITATFGNSATSNATIQLNLPITIGTISVNNAVGYQFPFNAMNDLTFSVSTGSANLTIGAGSHIFAYQTVLLDNLVITQSSPSLFSFQSNVSGAASVTYTGSGTSIVTGVGTYTGGTAIQGGVVNINNDTNFNSGAVTIGGGTLQFATPFNGASTASTALTFTLNGSATFDTQTDNITIPTAISGSGSLTKVGVGSLTLSSGGNSYNGGTTVTAGTLIVNSDANLGASIGGLTIGSATIRYTGSFNSSRAVTLSGSASFDTNGFNIGLSSSFTGSGSLTKLGAGTLTLTGAAPVTGGINVSAGTLVGNSTIFGSDILSNGTLVFNQTSNGTYSGALTGAGTLSKQGSGTLTLTGNSSSFTGGTQVSAGQLAVNGILSGALPLSVANGAALSGTGTLISDANISGELIPGASGAGTLTIQGALTLGATSVTTSQIAPLSNGLIAVSGGAFINGGASLQITPTPGFYGISASYTLLTSSALGGTFTTFTISDPNFSGTLSYPNNTVVLNVRILQPFLFFPFANSNEQAVGNNIDVLSASGALASDPDLASVINTLDGQSNAVINDALDQMHPAIFSAFAEMQAELGGQLLDLFHRKPSLNCGCCPQEWRTWVEPFGNWLDEKNQGQEVGFRSVAGGLAFGVDREILADWTIGIGGAWNSGNLHWSKDRGQADTTGAYGAFYTDYVSDRFYVGASVYAGRDWFDSHRRIAFTTIDRKADSHIDGLDAGGGFTAAYFFGSPVCLLYPYATVDYLYLQTGAFSEKSAQSLDLAVEEYSSSTLRSTAGFAFQFIDKNYAETICLSPLLAFGWAMNWPLERKELTSTFAGQSIPFEVHGWDETWQLLNLRFGLAITYRCFRFNGEYIADISPEGNSPFFNSRANFKLEWSF